MTWEQADSIFDHRLYGAHYKSLGNNQFKYYTLSGPVYILIKIGGKLFKEQWDFSCSVGVRYENQKVVDKVYDPFCD